MFSLKLYFKIMIDVEGFFFLLNKWSVNVHKFYKKLFIKIL